MANHSWNTHLQKEKEKPKLILGDWEKSIL